MDTDDSTVHKRKVRSEDIDVETADGNTETSEGLKDIIYGVEDRPPWYLCILLGFQHYLTMFGATYTVPILLYKHFCMSEDAVGLSELLGTVFFVSGICTLIQTTIGIRLPIVQSATFSFLAPTIAILSLHECKYETIPKANWTAAGLPEIGSDAHREIWQSRIAEVQGCIMVASLFQIFIGFTGLIGLMLRFISPIVIAPTITLIGMSLFEAAADKASKHWWIAITCLTFICGHLSLSSSLSVVHGSSRVVLHRTLCSTIGTVVLIAIFSQYLRNVFIPFPAFNRKKGCTVSRLHIFKLFPVLLGIVVSWIICLILTESGALTDNPKESGYAARTDANTEVLWKSKWFRFPYPGQWGVPTITVAGVFGMLAGVLASMVESVGDYYACARLCGAPPPPVHAVNRGIGMEGIGCLIAGAWGSGNGTTSYSENIGAIGITKVGSRLVVQVGALIMILLGCLGKVGALFVTIPEPVVGGVFIVMFGMIMAIGISNLQFVDLNSGRNLFIIGLSMLFGLTFPFWLQQGNNASSVSVGQETVDQIIVVLLKTSMFVGGFIAFVLDVTLPGTDEERGLKRWRGAEGTTVTGSDRMKMYDLPFIQPFLNRLLCTKYLPFCPPFGGCVCCGKNKDKQSDVSQNASNTNPTFQDDNVDTHL